MRYLDFLQLLAKLGPKLVVLWPHITAILEHAEAIVSVLRELPGERLLATAEPPTVTEQAEEDTVVAIFTGDLMAGAEPDALPSARAFPDFQRLRQLWNFVQDNPELLRWLMALIA